MLKANQEKSKKLRVEMQKISFKQDRDTADLKRRIQGRLDTLETLNAKLDPIIQIIEGSARRPKA